MKKKICTALVILLIGLIPLASANPGFKINSIGKFNNQSPESYLIEGVPYISQDEGDEFFGDHYCFWTSLEMVYRYYSINITKYQILYEVGGGYSFGYNPKLSKILFKPHIEPPYKFMLYTSSEMSQGTDDMKFQANLHGCSCNHVHPDSIVIPMINWIKYWNMLKYYISNDIPLITSVDCLAWPIFMEINNLSRIPLFIKSGHAIVLVGYNERNGTICCHDPYPGAVHIPEKGPYQWVSLEDFKRAVRRSYWDLINSNAYELIIIENLDAPRLPEDIAINIAHQRNLKRMKGEKSVYDSDYIGKNFKEFGIDALTELKKDFQKLFVRRLPPYWILCKNTLIKDWLDDSAAYFYYESIVKYDVSQYLLNNENVQSFCYDEGRLLEIESEYWRNLGFKMYDLFENLTEYRFLDDYNNCRILLKDIITIINIIILIEEAIINEDYKTYI